MTQEQRNTLIFVVAVLSLLITAIRFITEPSYETFAIVLSAIATILTLYAGKKRIERAEARYITKPRQLFNVSVALWGTTGSGKTWLIHALGRLLQTKYNGEINGLTYKLANVNEYDFSDQPNEPTMLSSDYIFRFERSRTSEKYSQSISSFQHQIRVIDNPGGQIVAPFQTNPDFPTYLDLDQIDNMAIRNIACADIVLVVLDPTYDNFGMDANNKSFLKTEYPRLVRELIRYLESDKSNHSRYYAVCITKADSIQGGVYIDPDALIEMCFGEKMTEALKIPDPKRIKTFTTSSAGYLIKNGREVPNINVHEGNVLIDVKNWQPYGVEFPFFWAFEELEKQSLRDSLQKSWWKRVSLERNLKKYIPYPKSNYELPKAK